MKSTRSAIPPVHKFFIAMVILVACVTLRAQSIPVTSKAIEVTQDVPNSTMSDTSDVSIFGAQSSSSQTAGTSATQTSVDLQKDNFAQRLGRFYTHDWNGTPSLRSHICTSYPGRPVGLCTVSKFGLGLWWLSGHWRPPTEMSIR